MARIVGKISTEGAQAIDEANHRADQLASLQAMQQSAEGVSVDEEMINLTQYQRAFQASTRVLQIIDGLLERVVSL